MRQSATAFMRATALQDDLREAHDKIRTLSDVLCPIAYFIGHTKSGIQAICKELLDNGITDYRQFFDRLGVLDTVHYVRYTSDDNNVTKVLLSLQKTPLWARFCSMVAEEATKQIVLIAVLRGKVALVLTNKAIKPYPGAFFHKVVSSNPAFNDVYMFKLEDLPFFLEPSQFHTN